MLSRRTLIAFCVALGLASAARIPSVFADPPRQANFVIVVAKDFPSDGMSFGDLKRLYLGEPVHVGGVELRAFGLKKDMSDRIDFDRAVLGMGPDDVGLYWIDRKLRGQKGAPKAVASPDILQHVVGRLPGTVGYVRASEVSGEVKELRIDGKTHDQPGYRVGG